MRYGLVVDFADSALPRPGSVLAAAAAIKRRRVVAKSMASLFAERSRGCQRLRALAPRGDEERRAREHNGAADEDETAAITNEQHEHRGDHRPQRIAEPLEQPVHAVDDAVTHFRDLRGAVLRDERALRRDRQCLADTD